VNIAVAIGAQVNKFLGFLQDVSCERNLKHFVLVREAFLASFCTLSLRSSSFIKTVLCLFIIINIYFDVTLCFLSGNCWTVGCFYSWGLVQLPNCHLHW
jgi:hypothetical protein